MTPALTLIFAAAAALVNLWLSIRCGRVRASAKISHGDGGNPLLARRMRAQLNFAENTPVVLVLYLALELAGTDPLWLSIIAPVYILARIAHAIGMDAESDSKARMAGVMLTMLVTLILVGLAVWSGYMMVGGEAMPVGPGMSV